MGPLSAASSGAAPAYRATGWLRRHTRAVQVTGGLLLVGIGTLLLTGGWGQVIAWLRAPIGGFTIPL